MIFLSYIKTPYLSKHTVLSLLACFLAFCAYAQYPDNLKLAYKNASKDTDRLVALNNLAEWYNQKNADTARFYAKLAYQMREKAPNIFEKTRALIELGTAFSKSNVSENQARGYFKQALEEAQKSNDAKTLGLTYMRFGSFCLYRGNTTDAIANYNQAKTYYEKIQDRTQLQLAYHQLATAYSQAGKPKNALDNYLQALKIVQTLGKKDMAGLLSDIGNVYYNQGNFAEALSHYKKALQESEHINDVFSQGFCLNNIGLVHGSLGNHDEALEYHLKALKMREQAKSEEGIANSYNNIGNTYIQLGYHEKGRKYIMQALTVEKRLGDRLSVASSYDYIGSAFLQNKKYQEALEQFEEALKIRKDMGQILEMGISYNHLGMAYMRHKDFPNAISNLKRADSIFTQTQSQDKLMDTHILLAKIYFELSDFAKSEKYAENAFKSATRRRTKPEIVESAQILAQIYAKQSNHLKAYEYQNQALAYKDSIHTEEKNARALRMQALFEFKQQEKEMAKLKDDNYHIVRLQYITLAIFTLLSIVLGAFVYYLWISRKRNQLKNSVLASKNTEITQQAQEIVAQKHAIESQNTEIMAKNQAIENQNNELQKAHKKLQEANQELIDSINYAHRIQRAVLPTQQEIKSVLPNYFILYKPRNVVSGDFYWISDKEHHTVVAVMDCTGHGIPGAFMSLIGNDILHEIVNLREIIEPSFILTELKKRVNIVLKQHTTQGRDGMDIGVCVIDHPPIRQGIERKLHFASAHLTLFYFQDRQMLELEGSKIYIGGYDPDETEKHFTTQTLVLDKPTACYLFSDGYQDQFAENSRKKFTKKRLKNILADVQLLPANIQQDILEETMNEWKGQAEQTDDMMVFGMMF